MSANLSHSTVLRRVQAANFGMNCSLELADFTVLDSVTEYDCI